ANLLKGSFNTAGVTHKAKQEAWEHIASHLHESYSDGKRTVKDCQKRWQSVQSDAKSKDCQIQTGSERNRPANENLALPSGMITKQHVESVTAMTNPTHPTITTLDP
ncbi:hypothetical protein Pcinc_024943, partial [Petrolisthes cinctipes]